MCSFSASAISSSRKSGCATLISASAEKAAHQILDDPECGDVFRIKGFVKLEENAAAVTENEKMNSGSAQKVSADNNWLELNATRKEFSLRPISAGQEVVIVIGENMNEARIREYLGTANIK